MDLISDSVMENKEDSSPLPVINENLNDSLKLKSLNLKRKRIINRSLIPKLLMNK